MISTTDLNWADNYPRK